jgi:hypothetical protein
MIAVVLTALAPAIGSVRPDMPAAVRRCEVTEG